MTSDERHTVLALRALGLGDLLTAVPALRGLRRAFPDSRLLLACPAVLRPLVQLVGGVDDVLDTPAFRLDPLPRLTPHVAVNLHGKGPLSTAVLRATGPRRLLAWDVGDGPRWRRDEHEVHRWCRLLAGYGIPADPTDLRLRPPVTGPAVGAAVVVHPGASTASRRWPAEHFATVARELVARGETVVVTGSAAERELATAVAAAAGLDDAAVLAGRTDLATLAATVAAARLVVCGDTGVAHLATAYATPSVVLFGPTPPSLWGPPAGDRRHRVLWAGGTGDPHADRVDPGLASISVEEVLATVDTQLRPSGDAARNRP